MRLATVARELFRFDPVDEELPDFFDDASLDLLPLEREPPADLRDELPDDDELLDLPPDEELLLLFAPPELFDELERPLPPDDFDELAALRPDDEDDADLDLPDEADEPPDLPPPLLALEREEVLFAPEDRPLLRDEVVRPPPAPIFSAAAPTAPIAAPAAAPLMISPATSITLSTIFDELVRRDPDDRPFDEDDEDGLLFREPLELLLLAITFPPK